jgi:hypothetical protein
MPNHDHSNPRDASNYEAQVRRALEIIVEPGSVAELRIPHTAKGTISGYFTDLELMATCAAEWSGKAPGVYVTLNPVRPELLARARNRTVPFAKHTTTDADILRRRWLPIDLDPVRPAGISSTNAEHEAALERAKECSRWLHSRKWPEPILGGSGNGTHLLYRVELPNDSASTDLVKRCLTALDLQFSDNDVSVDVGTYNAARIWKAYGNAGREG